MLQSLLDHQHHWKSAAGVQIRGQILDEKAADVCQNSVAVFKHNVRQKEHNLRYFLNLFFQS